MVLDFVAIDVETANADMGAAGHLIPEMAFTRKQPAFAGLPQFLREDRRPLWAKTRV